MQKKQPLIEKYLWLVTPHLTADYAKIDENTIVKLLLNSFSNCSIFLQKSKNNLAKKIPTPYGVGNIVK